MFDKLFEYFSINKKVNLPGVGVFIIDHKPAHLDFLNKTLYAPSSEIRFSSGFAEPDKNFNSYLSNGWNNNKLDNIRQFNDFLFDIQHKLSDNSQIPLPFFGALRKDAADNYSFEQDFSIDEFFPSITAERVIRTGAKHLVKTGDTEYTNAQMQVLLAEKPHKDYWKVYAVILAVIGVAALACYYFFIY